MAVGPLMDDSMPIDSWCGEFCTTDRHCLLLGRKKCTNNSEAMLRNHCCIPETISASFGPTVWMFPMFCSVGSSLRSNQNYFTRLTARTSHTVFTVLYIFKSLNWRQWIEKKKTKNHEKLEKMICLFAFFISWNASEMKVVIEFRIWPNHTRTKMHAVACENDNNLYHMR